MVMGDGPLDLVYVFGYQSNIDADGDVPFHAAFRQRLAEHFRLILFDRRGTGLSDRTDLEDARALELGMDDIRAVMDIAGSQRALLFGLNDGSLLSALFAASHPDRVLGLVAWGLFAKGMRSADYPWGWTEAEWEGILEEVETTWGSLEYAESDLREVAPSIRLDRTTIERVAKMFRSVASPGTALGSLRAVRDSDIRAVLPAVQVPTLVIHSANGSDSDESRHAAEIVPAAAIVEVEGDDLLPFWGCAERVVEEIRSFAAKIQREEEVLDRVLATILFTDIVGSTERANELGDHAWKALVERHHAVVRAMLARYRGQEVDTAGDGFFATFDGPARGVRCAQAIVEAVRPLGLEIRAGLHTGEVETVNGKVGGIGVVIGSRVGSVAGASEVLVSSTVKDLVAGSGLVFEDAGEYELKGVPGRWRLYRAVGAAA